MQTKRGDAGKRVLMIRNVQPYDFGGGERIPVHLALEIAKHGYRTLLVSRAPKVLDYARSKGVEAQRGWWWSRQDWSGANNLLLPLYFGWQAILTAWYCLLIIRTKAAIVHPQGKDDFIAATLAAKLLGRPIIWSDYADLKYLYQNHTVWYKNPVGKLIFRLSRWAQAIILTSHSDETFIKQALGRDTLPSNYVVVYNGVTDREVTPAERSADDTGAYVYCATSRMVTAKGIGELVEAFKALHREHPDVRLWLAGDGPESERFQEMAGGHPAITFLGHVEAPLPLVAACDVFVHPSYLEGFSISLIEAAMLQKPIICCDVGGNPEIVVHQQTGLLIPDRDSQALLAAMQRLYDDRRLAATLARNARQHFESELRFEKLVSDKFVPLYDKAA